MNTPSGHPNGVSLFLIDFGNNCNLFLKLLAIGLRLCYNGEKATPIYDKKRCKKAKKSEGSV